MPTHVSQTRVHENKYMEDQQCLSACNPYVHSTAVVAQLRLLYSQLLRNPLEASDLTWERMKALVERGSRSSIKSRRGPRPGAPHDGPPGEAGTIKGASTLFEVYDILDDELLPQLLQQLQQQKTATLEELQLPTETAEAKDGFKPIDGATRRAALKERGKLSAAAIAADAHAGSVRNGTAVCRAAMVLLLLLGTAAVHAVWQRFDAFLVVP